MQKQISNSYLVLLLVFATLSLFACSKPGSVKPASSGGQSLVPAWVNDPSHNGHIGVVGSAMPQKIGGLEGQRRAALLRARAQLAREVRTRIKKRQTFTRTENTEDVVVNQKIESKSTELQQLDSAFIKAEWIHPATSELFIWLVIRD